MLCINTYTYDICTLYIYMLLLSVNINNFLICLSFILLPLSSLWYQQLFFCSILLIYYVFDRYNSDGKTVVWSKSPSLFQLSAIFFVCFIFYGYVFLFLICVLMLLFNHHLVKNIMHTHMRHLFLHVLLVGTV